MSLDLNPADYSLRNRGPWTVVSVEDWGGFCLGQTTAAEGSFNADFHSPERRGTFFSLFPVRSVHEADQVHGDRLVDVPPHSTGHLGCDGLTAGRSSVMLTMRTADCYPVFVKNHRDERFGILHAGWRGLRDRIVTKALREWFDDPADVLVGAGIEGSRYEVSREVVEEVARSHDTSPSVLKDEGILVDECLRLPELIRWQCEKAPRSIRSLKRLPFGTGEDSPVPMYSYRENGTDSRMVSWIFKFPD